jgi:hypothetical protein
MRWLLLKTLAAFYTVAFWALMILAVATLAEMAGHCQTPPRQCSNAALIRALYVAGELLRPEPPPVAFDAAQWQITPVFVAPNATPGPAWIPPSRCRGQYAQSLTGEQLQTLAMFGQWRQVQWPRLYDECFAIPADVSIPAWWWEWQQAEHCGWPELNYVEGNYRRICWGNIERANAGLVIPGTPSPAPIARAPRTLPTKRPTPTRDKAAERAEMLSEFMELSRLCGTLRD